MLDKTDVQQIGKLLDEKLKPIKETLDQHTQILDQHTRELKKHGKLLRHLKEDQDVIAKSLDKEQMQQRKRLIRVEKHLSLSPLT